MWNIAAWTWFGISGLSAVLVALDMARHRPRMSIMRVVWPITAVWAGPFGVVAYWRLGRRNKPPLPLAAVTAATHGGAGCPPGDIAAATFAVVVPLSIAGHASIGHPFGKTTPVFWLMMQVAMFAGFLTSYPVNVMLPRRCLKEAM
jgi:hypothetical protein